MEHQAREVRKSDLSTCHAWQITGAEFADTQHLKSTMWLRLNCRHRRGCRREPALPGYGFWKRERGREAQDSQGPGGVSPPRFGGDDRNRLRTGASEPKIFAECP